jgi:triosephosphate isomerase
LISFSLPQQPLPRQQITNSQGFDQLEVIATTARIEQTLLAEKRLIALEPVLDIGGGRLVDAHMQNQGACGHPMPKIH